MKTFHACLTENRARRVAVRLMQAATLALVFATAMPSHAADDREVRSRVNPAYPELAKRMKIGGAVKVEVRVDADGKVTEAKAVSGNSILEPAAEAAVRQWKFAPGAGVATVVVELHFAVAQ
jgi:TonB family protein